MKPLLYSINVMLDGCIDHTVASPDEAMFQNVLDYFHRVDTLLFGRVTYQLMEYWRTPDPGLPPWMMPFVHKIGALKKYVVSRTLQSVPDWNVELVKGDLIPFVEKLKQEPGKGIGVGGVTMPRVLVENGLIDEYELVVHPKYAGHGPYLFAGLAKPVELVPVARKELTRGVVATRYQPAR